jgi:hypothetical protein
VLPLPQGDACPRDVCAVGAVGRSDRLARVIYGGPGANRGPLASQVVAIDGKAVRPRFDRAIDRGPFHIVRAWATAAPFVLRAVAVAEQSQAITAIHS